MMDNDEMNDAESIVGERWMRFSCGRVAAG
jgi:hypothetical protein